jgi:NADPH:quinone reductase-like Zn-dependent oxidoreductase
LAQDYSKNTIIDNLDAWARPEQTIYLLARGTPVNFIDAAVIGPALSLVQAEIIVAIGEIFSAEASGEISEVGSHLKRSLADTWYKFFCNPETGAYRP